eukprot:g31980.t1
MAPPKRWRTRRGTSCRRTRHGWAGDHGESMPTGLNRLNLTPLRSACRKFHWQHALHLLDGLWAVGHRPGAVPCSEVLRSMARRRRWQPALALLAELRERRLKLDTVCFNIGMHACEQHWEPGRTWLVEIPVIFGTIDFGGILAG